MGRALTALLACAVLALGSTSSGFAAELYKAEAGPFEIRMVDDVTLHDARRGKDIPLRITYPVGEGKVPALVFSHGAWAARYFYAPLARHWASHGYAVIQPTHADSSDFGYAWDDPVVFSEEIRYSRPQDVSAIISAINQLGVPGLDGRIDEDRIAAGGHSYGADTTMMAGGLKSLNSKGEAVDYSDPRIKAMMPLSGQGLDESRTKEAFAAIDIPTLFMTGTRDPARLDRPYTWRLDPFTYATPGNKFLVFVEGLDHGFGKTVLPDPEFPQPPPSGVRPWRDDAVHGLVTKSATTAFLDAFLNGDQAALEYLKSDQMERATNGVAKLSYK
ncbi:MAG: hypothetical protein HXY25_01580 [Alphaproteobacteria bacterium]|nr:hypothetical protein [Alphaproteobacteria bacterium]